MKITTMGIDLAKSVFSIHGVDEHGKCVLKKQVRHDQLQPLRVAITFPFVLILGGSPYTQY